MPITFLIPGPLRPFASGRSQIVIEESPATLTGALEALWRQCPGIRDRMMNEQAQIREHINVFVGNENIRYTGGLQTPIPPGAEIAIIPAISGGVLPQPRRQIAHRAHPQQFPLDIFM